MASSDPGVRPSDVERWLLGLELDVLERADRDGISSWDLILDGRQRYDLRVTVILDPALALIAWAHYAPPLTDLVRKAYRRLLRWNDEFPFVKFSISEDERPLLTAEIPIGDADADLLGLALARIVDVADRCFDESTGWLWLGGRVPDQSDRRTRNPGLLDRYAHRLAAATE